MGVIAEEVDADGREQFEGWRYLDWATTRDATPSTPATRG